MKQIVFFAMLLLSLNVSAQILAPIQASALSNMPSCHGSQVVVRNYGRDQVVVHHVELSNKYVHHFAIQRQDTNAMRELVVVLGGQGVFDTTYAVNDMRVLGDTCYFCGIEMVDHGAPLLDYQGNPISPQVYKRGVVGRFSLSALINGEEADFHLTTISETAEFTRLDAARPYPNVASDLYRVMLTAVGRYANNGEVDGSCLLEMADYQQGGWMYSLVDADGQEVFCDVVTAGWAKYVASFYYGDGEDPDQGGWNLVLHDCTSDGFSARYAHQNLSETATLYDFGRMGWGWHDRDGQVRMCHLYDNRIGLAFGSKNSTTDEWGILAMVLSDATVIDTITAIKTSPHVQVKDMTYLPLVNQLGIMAWDDMHWYHGVWLARIGHSGSIPLLSRPNMQIRSVCRYANRTIMVGGYDVLNQKVYSMWQHPQAVERPHCINVGEAESERLQAVGDKHRCVWKDKVFRHDVGWLALPTTILDAHQEFECTQPLWFIERERL